jgi:hypothetical protein
LLPAGVEGTAMVAENRWESRTLSTIDELELDPENPRLPRKFRGASQDELMSILIGRFDAEGIAEAIVTAGFLQQDPIAGYEHEGRVRVREGNRRLAATKLLLDPSLAPDRYRSRFESLAARLDGNVRQQIERLDVQVWADANDPELTAYIGYRHVTGVRSWPPIEKASFIADLIAKENVDYALVASQIGSKPRHVERHYVAFKLVEQAIAHGLPGAEEAEDSFGVLLRALQSKGIPDFLGIAFTGVTADASDPVPAERLENLGDFLRWTFGTPDAAKVLGESRQLTKWAHILSTPESLEYLRRTPEPNFDRAWEKSGGEATTLADALYNAAEQLREAVPIIADHQMDPDVAAAFHDCVRFFRRLEHQVPELTRGAEAN